MSTEYGTARWLREEYDPETRLLTITVCDMRGDWQHYAERVRIVPADAIVIERAALPEVVAEGGGVISAAGWGQTTVTNPGYVRTQALALLALAEYLDAHPPAPPVSDEDVETLAGLLWEYAQNPSGPGDTFAETSEGERNRFRNRAERVLTARGPNGERVSVTHE